MSCTEQYSCLECIAISPVKIFGQGNPIKESREPSVPPLMITFFGSLVFRYFNLGDKGTLYFHTLSVMSYLAFGGIIGFLAYQGKIKLFFERLSRLHIIILY
jgi:hypothetical protein